MQNALFDPKMQMTKKLTIFFLKGKSEPKDKEFFILNFSIKKKNGKLLGGKAQKNLQIRLPCPCHGPTLALFCEVVPKECK